MRDSEPGEKSRRPVLALQAAVSGAAVRDGEPEEKKVAAPALQAAVSGTAVRDGAAGEKTAAVS